MTMTTAALAAEITTDPKALGYAAFVLSGDDTALADRLNTTYAGVGVVRRMVTNTEIVQCFVAAELKTRTQTQLLSMQLVLAPKMVDTSIGNIVDIFADVWAGTATLSALDVLSRVPAPTRAEELWGAGTVITATNVAHALGR